MAITRRDLDPLIRLAPKMFDPIHTARAMERHHLPKWLYPIPIEISSWWICSSNHSTQYPVTHWWLLRGPHLKWHHYASSEALKARSSNSTLGLSVELMLRHRELVLPTFQTIAIEEVIENLLEINSDSAPKFYGGVVSMLGHRLAPLPGVSWCSNQPPQLVCGRGGAASVFTSTS